VETNIKDKQKTWLLWTTFTSIFLTTYYSLWSTFASSYLSTKRKGGWHNPKDYTQLALNYHDKAQAQYEGL